MILLDTHVVVWAAIKPGRLSRAAARALQTAASTRALWISAASLYELALLLVHGSVRGTGRLSADIERIVSLLPAGTLDVTPEIAAIAASFPVGFPRDPMDRIIAAT